MSDLWMQYARTVFTAWQTVALIPSVLFALWLIVPLRHRGSVKYDRCVQCGYAVKGLTKPTCPECGSDLSKRGVYLAGHPRYRTWAIRLVAWTAVWLGVALLFSGPLSHHVPQTYRVVWYTHMPSYVDDEIGYFISLSVNGIAFRWPWQQTVTTRATSVIFRTSMVNSHSGGTDIWWNIPQNTICLPATGNTQSRTFSGPLTADFISSHLQIATFAEPTRTARLLMAQIDNRREMTAEARRDHPVIKARKPILWAAPAEQRFVTTLVHWVCLVMWIIGDVIFHRRWHRGKRIDWDAN